MHVLHKIFLFLMLLTTSLFKTEASYFEQIRHGIVPNYCDIVIPGLIECIIIMCASSSKKSSPVKIGIVITGSFLNWLLYNYLYSNTRQGILDQKSLILDEIKWVHGAQTSSNSNPLKRSLQTLLSRRPASINEKSDHLNKKLSFLNEPVIAKEPI